MRKEIAFLIVIAAAAPSARAHEYSPSQGPFPEDCANPSNSPQDVAATRAFPAATGPTLAPPHARNTLYLPASPNVFPELGSDAREAAASFPREHPVPRSDLPPARIVSARDPRRAESGDSPFSPNEKDNTELLPPGATRGAGGAGPWVLFAALLAGATLGRFLYNPGDRRKARDLRRRTWRTTPSIKVAGPSGKMCSSRSVPDRPSDPGTASALIRRWAPLSRRFEKSLGKAAEFLWLRRERAKKELITPKPSVGATPIPLERKYTHACPLENTADAWRALDPILGRDVIVRRLCPEPGKSLAACARRARAAARLSHPHITDVYEIRETADGIWIASELFPGRSLAAALAEGERMPPSRIEDIARQMLGALAYAHSLGVSHGSVALSRILIAEQGHAKLTGFEIPVAGAESGNDLSPYASDVRALGLCVFEALTGTPAPAGRRPSRPSALQPGIPLHIDDWVDRLLADRPPSAEAALRGILRL